MWKRAVFLAAFEGALFPAGCAAASIVGREVASRLAERQAILQRAYVAHPERFVKGAPLVPQLPAAVWINPPKSDAESTNGPTDAKPESAG